MRGIKPTDIGRIGYRHSFYARKHQWRTGRLQWSCSDLQCPTCEWYNELHMDIANRMGRNIVNFCHYNDTYINRWYHHREC
jgi:hypothetical protein